MMGDVVALHVFEGDRRPRVTSMVCIECGVASSASCNCGAAYVRPGTRVEAFLSKEWALTNVAVAERIGVDEASVRRARKRMIRSQSAPAEYRVFRSDGRPRTVKLQTASAQPVKLYRHDKRRGGKKRPVTDKEHLIAFTRELSSFVSDFTIELIKWLDREPKMERAGRTALVSTLEAFSMQLQSLAQRVDGR